ncbi:MAG: alpha/beta fold hydrolase [Gammaproteobacteria bacterium]|nr:alpha/beta fold hydrolase [Gammaproteobacteria bacterium]
MTRTIADLGPHVARRYPFQSQFANVNGWRMHYIDEGPRDAPPVLMLHGNPTWGYLWRDVIPPVLAAGYRVIVPDQVGFGLSEHPHAASAHSLDNHAANLVALIDQLDLDGIFFVCHDWGGPTGLSALLTRPERAVAVAVMSTWAWREPSAEFHRRIMPWLTLHAPLVGPFLSGRQAAFPGRSTYLSVVDRERIKEDALDVYVSVLPDADDRRLTWQWPRSIPIDPATDIAGERFEWLETGVRALRLPATVIWGREEVVFAADAFAPVWHEIWPHAEGTHLVTGNHFLQEDSGAEIGDILVDFAMRHVPVGEEG